MSDETMTYDEVTDALYVYFSQEPVARTEEVTDRLIVDYDASGSVRGIELLDARSRSAALAALDGEKP